LRKRGLKAKGDENAGSHRRSLSLLHALIATVHGLAHHRLEITLNAFQSAVVW
jgi:hypothetical protein